MENVGVFNVRLEHFPAIGYILWLIGNLIRFIFRHFGILCQENSGMPGR
jgi:hypothetical protein